MEAAAKQLMDQGAQRILKAGKKVAVELTEAGSKAKTNEILAEVKRVSDRATLDTFTPKYISKVIIHKNKKIGKIRTIRLKINHMINKLLGKYGKGTEEAGEKFAEKVTEETGKKLTQEASIGNLHRRQEAKLRESLERQSAS